MVRADDRLGLQPQHGQLLGERVVAVAVQRGADRAAQLSEEIVQRDTISRRGHRAQVAAQSHEAAVRERHVHGRARALGPALTSAPPSSPGRLRPRVRALLSSDAARSRLRIGFVPTALRDSDRIDLHSAAFSIASAVSRAFFCTAAAYL